MDEEQKRKWLESMGYNIAPKNVSVKMRETEGDSKNKKTKKTNPDQYVDKKELLRLGKIFEVK